MKINTIYQYLILIEGFALIFCKNYYTVIAPGLLKSNRKYAVAVTLHDSSVPCTISVSISGRSYNATDAVLLQPLETKKLEFFPPKLEMGHKPYELIAEGSRGCEFRNQSELLIDTDAGPKIYMQTDKSVYKPLDLVQFRVVILDEHTRPLNVREPIRVEIFDNNKNRVKQFKDIVLTKGVFTEKLQLSQQPVMGEWELRASISGRYSHQVSKKFTVQLYTLPKFSVYIEAPESMTIANPHIRAEIYGKYTFDRYVEGTLVVELHSTGSNTIFENRVLSIDGLEVVEFHFPDISVLDTVDALYLIAILEEKHTGIRHNDLHTILVRDDSYKVWIHTDEIEFRNRKPFRLKATVEDWNEGPVWDSETPVTLEHGDKKYQTYLNEKGVALFEFVHQKGADFRVRYKDSMKTLPSIYAPEERVADSPIYCSLTLKESPRLGKPVQIEVRSSAYIPYLVYTVVGHSGIIQMEHINISGQKKRFTINLNPSIEMVPSSFLYVYYVQDGNLRYEELKLQFPEELENQISVIAPKQVKPGQEVTLKLKAQPKSYVSIMAVDLSVYLLDNKYDIYKKTRIQDLNNDISYIVDAHIVRPGIISGLLTLTNANYPIITEFTDAVASDSVGPWDFRTKFPETWIFDNYIINNTETDIVLNIPDTITTWRITAFSNNDITGFGIVNGPTDITTFLPFFITLNLPYSVKSGETVNIPVTIFNYHNHSLDTDITMFNLDKDFQFMQPLSKYTPRDQQNVIIPPNKGKTINFLIQPMRIGEIEIRIAANNSLYSDGIVKKLNVIPEGITKYKNVVRYLSAADAESSLTLAIPQDRVSDSEYITLSVGGDYMIPTLENLNDMIKMPTGCGEQNMINFAPNILVLDYMKATGRLTKEKNLVRKAKYYIEIGYQQQLSYRHKDGGYSAFGESKSKESSTWLTAYVVRFLIKASKYTPIESRIIDSGLEYLASGQLHDGSFPYTGYLFYTELQDTFGFTAFVLLTFMEDRRYSRKYQTLIRKGLHYITSDLELVNDLYALSIIGTALTKAKHPDVQKVLHKIQNLIHNDENAKQMWLKEGSHVETIAYILMIFLEAPGNHLPVLKWLIEQRNEQGGFKSTHDTVVGLEALVKFAQKYNNESEWDLKITYSAQDHKGNEKRINEFLINQDNALTLQQHELPRSVRHINFKISGTGYSLVQLSARYNVKHDNEIKHFKMKISPTIYNDEEVDLQVCFTYQALQTISNSTNMVIMEANLPSGFKTEAEFSRDLLENEFIQRIETKNDETTMVLYFDKLSTETRHCVNIEAFRANEVEERKSSSIVMYDYYNIERKNSEFYTI